MNTYELIVGKDCKYSLEKPLLIDKQTMTAKSEDY